MEKGILIIACGHPFFGRMAHNLAASVKSISPEIPIALRWAGTALNHLQTYNLSDVFDSVEQIPEDCYMVDGKQRWIRTKLFAYDLSPFEKTIFLDADTICNPQKTPAQLFKELDGVDITFANYTHYDLAHLSSDAKIWANLNDIKKAYAFESGYYYALQSEMIYFTRSEKVAAFFETAKQIYDSPKVKTTEFAGFIADEFAFSTSAVIHGIEPHQSPYCPTYWHPVQRKLGHKKGIEQHYLLSVGGAFQPDRMKQYYNQYAAIAFRKLGLETPWKYLNKRSWLPERKLI